MKFTITIECESAEELEEALSELGDKVTVRLSRLWLMLPVGGAVHLGGLPKIDIQRVE